jgi:transcriptional regulator with XRE-family HTH domain
MSPDQPKSAVTQALADAIRAAREEAGLTVDAVAARAGFEKPVYEAIESGQSQVSVETVVQIARALEVSASKLLGRAAL